MSKTNKTSKASAQKSNNTITGKDIKQQVTDRIIAIMERGTEAWQKTWKAAAGAGFPSNASSGKAYQGINIVILWAAAQDAGYASSKWLTYKQAAALGATVRKGERGTGIVFYSPLQIEDEATGEEKEICMLKSFVVFNIAQIDGLPVETLETDMTPEPFSPHELAERVIGGSGASIEFGGNQPCYVPSLDVVRMPHPESFKTAENYYTTMAHELSHWTGHSSRLDRNLKGKCGTADYAREELCAELTAAFLSAHFGMIDGSIEQHASYLDSWLKVLKEDKCAIFQAASAAQKAYDYLLDKAA